MRYDDAQLDRALAALPLEEPPPDLRARILLATIQRPVPVFQTWELWMLGVAFAVVTWLVLALIGSPVAGGDEMRSAIAWGIGTFTAALRPSLLLWLGVGVLAALALQFSEKALAVLHRVRP